MITAYIFILLVSAWAIAYGLAAAFSRTARLLKRPTPVPHGMVALGVALAMLIVVGAPAWLFFALAALVLGPRLITAAPPLRLSLLVAALPLVVAPLLGASMGFALDAALIAASVLGESHAS